MAKYIIHIVLIISGFAAALWTWYGVVHAVEIDGISTYLMPGIAVSVMSAAALLLMVLAQRWYSVAVMAALCFGSALFFVQGAVVSVASMIGVLGYIAAWRAVRSDMRNHLRIRVFAHAHAGSNRVVMVTAIMISAVFYQALIARDAAHVLLSHSLHATVTGPIARMVLPAPLAQGSGPHGEVTVDDFIAQMLQKHTSAADNISLQFLEDYAAAVRNRMTALVPRAPQQSARAAVVPDIVRSQARAELSKQLGLPLTGTEPVADVFVQSLERQIQTFARERVLPQGYTFSTALAGVIAFFLFLTMSWIGAFVKFLWIYAAHGIFALLRRMGVVQVVYVPAEKEEIA